MSVLTADFEKGTVGQPVLTTDAGSQTAWDALSDANPVLSYSATAAHGSQGGAWTPSAGAGGAYAQWSTALGTVSGAQYGRTYIYLPFVPGTNGLGLVSYLLTATQGAEIGFLNTSLHLFLRDSTGSGGTQSTGTVLATGQWCRVEWQVTISATVGVISASIYNSADSITADFTLTSSSLNTLATANTFRIGQIGSNPANGFDWFLDQIVTNAPAAVGPFPVNTTAPTISGSVPAGSVLTAGNGAWNVSGTFTYTYQWTRGGVNIGGATSSTYTTVSADVGHAIGCTVTATGLQATNEVAAQASSNTITPTSAGGFLSFL